jgi:uncharacterized protein involved in response to NO
MRALPIHRTLATVSNGVPDMTSADLDAGNVPVVLPEAVLTRRGPHLFFALAAVYGAMGLILWVIAYRLHWADRLPATMWHAHEMVYGFAAAGLAGVLAALVPRWSGALPISDTRLTVLAGVWLLGRIAMATGGVLPSWAVAVVDLSFLPLFAITVVGPHIAARPHRNLGLLLLLALLWLGQGVMDAETFGATFGLAERGARIGTVVYLLLIAAIGGYAIPDTTNRFLGAHAEKETARSLTALDVLSVGSLALYLASDAIAGIGILTSIVALGAAIVNGLRLWLWRGYRIRSVDLTMFHLGYLWMVVGLLLEAAVPIAHGVADMAAIHVLSAGAVGTMLLAVISRESLLHGAHRLAATPTTMISYTLVSLAVVLRIAALFVPGAFVPLVIASGTIWAAGFLVLLVTYLPARPVS